MRPPPLIGEQIAYAEDELERMLRLFPRLVSTGVRPLADVEREIALQTAIVSTLKRQARVLEALPVDLLAACDGIAAEVARIRGTVEA